MLAVSFMLSYSVLNENIYSLPISFPLLPFKVEGIVTVYVSFPLSPIGANVHSVFPNSALQLPKTVLPMESLIIISATSLSATGPVNFMVMPSFTETSGAFVFGVVYTTLTASLLR